MNDEYKSPHVASADNSFAYRLFGFPRSSREHKSGSGENKRGTRTYKEEG